MIFSIDFQNFWHQKSIISWRREENSTEIFHNSKIASGVQISHHKLLVCARIIHFWCVAQLYIFPNNVFRNRKPLTVSHSLYYLHQNKCYNHPSAIITTCKSTCRISRANIKLAQDPDALSKSIIVDPIRRMITYCYIMSNVTLKVHFVIPTFYFYGIV